MTARARPMARRRVLVVRRGHRARPYVLVIGHSAPTVNLTALAQRRRGLLEQQERDERRNRLAAALVVLMGLVGLAFWLSRGLL